MLGRKRNSLPAATATHARATTAKSKRRKPSGRSVTPATTPPLVLQLARAPAPTSSVIPAPALSVMDVRDACYALSKKLARDRQGRRQNGRRSKAEQFRLADNQKYLFAKAIKSARNAARAVDYDLLSNSCHFPTFRGHPDVLAAMESSVVDEMTAALEEQRAIEATSRPVRSPAWKEELSRVNTAHRNLIAEMDRRAEALVARIAASEDLVEELRARLRRANDDGLRVVQADGVPVSSQTVAVDADVVGDAAFPARELPDADEHLRQREHVLQAKEAELTALAATLKSQQTAVQEQARGLDDERHLLDARLALIERLERGHRDKLTSDHERQQAWKRDQAAIEKEIKRLIGVLEEQKDANGYAPTIEKWKRQTETEEQASRAAQAALEGALRDVARLQNEVADLRLQLDSYVACGTTEKRIELLAKHFADPDFDDISTRHKQRKFAVKLMKRVHSAQAAWLDQDLIRFADIRNYLCHDNNGNDLFAVPHADFQSLCQKIQATMRDLHQALA